MKKYFIAIFLMLFLAATCRLSRSYANDLLPTGTVIINEISPGSSTSASQEFIELYNYGDDEISLEGWSVQYASSASLSWRSLSNITVSDNSIPAKGYYVLASKEYLTDKSSANYSAALAQSAGQIRLVNADGIVEDEVSWGATATMALGNPALPPYAGQSISRKLYQSEPINSQNNRDDFVITDTLTPLSMNAFNTSVDDNSPSTNGDPTGSQPDSSATTEINPSQSPTATSTSNAALTLKPLKISEILPNPSSPHTDGADEYVELFNPNQTPVDLTGYTIIAGSSDKYRYKISNGSIPAGGYATFYSANTTLTLSNTDGRVKLLTPDNSQVDITSSYSDAPDGQSWIKTDTGWKWTTTPTANRANVYTKPADKINVLSAHTSNKSASDIPAGPYYKLEISELLPNPASPQTDAEDEFIELHNPNNHTVNLKGYKIITGLKGSYKYTFKGSSIPAGGYLALYSSNSNLTLSNTSGMAVLMAPDGSGIDATRKYDKADDGSAWIFANGKWQWTIVPTPGKPNIFRAPASSGGSGFSAITNRDSAVTGNGASGQNSQQSLAKKRISQPWIIAAVGGAAVVYACYEYRHDVANLLQRFRRYRETRRAIG